MKIQITIISLLLTQALAASLPDAPQGFKWMKFKEEAVKIRVPVDWNVYHFEEGMAKVVQITKDAKTTTGFDTGLTIQYFQCKSAEEFRAVMRKSGEFMANLHGQFIDLEVSNAYDEGGRRNMILEGTRNIPERANNILYHTRTAVRAFTGSLAVYIYVFGSPNSMREEVSDTADIMLNPIVFLDAG